MVTPSCAVTATLIVLIPTAKPTAPEAVPLLTVVPFTVTVAVASVTTGVTVIDAVALLTDDV